MYVWTSQRFVAIVLFTCKAFDAERAVAFCREHLAMTATEHLEF